MVTPSSPAGAVSSPSIADDVEQDVVASFDSMIEAELAHGRLEIEGIASRILNVSPTAVYAPTLNAAGAVKLYVPLADLEAARSILFAPSALIEDMPQESPPAVPAPSATVDELAQRAARAAIIGTVALPPILNFYSLVLLAQLANTRGTLSARGRRQVGMTIVFDAIVFSLMGAIAWALFT